MSVKLTDREFESDHCVYFLSTFLEWGYISSPGNFAAIFHDTTAAGRKQKWGKMEDLIDGPSCFNSL